MVHYRVIARHDLGDRVREILCAVAEVALNYGCLAAGSDHDQAARMGNDRHLAAGREEYEVNRLFDDCPLGNLDAGAIIEVSSVHRNNRTILVGRVTRQVRFDGAVRFAQRSGADAPWKLLARGVGSPVAAIDKHQPGTALVRGETLIELCHFPGVQIGRRGRELCFGNGGDVDEAPLLIPCRWKPQLSEAPRGILTDCFYSRHAVTASSTPV